MIYFFPNKTAILWPLFDNTIQEGRLALHYAPHNANAMRLYSVLINHGADPSAEDARGHNPQYYIDHGDEILIPEWSNKWSNMINAQSPQRKKSERATAAKERNALAKSIANAAKSARQKSRAGRVTNKLLKIC